MMTPAMRADLAGREQDIQRGKTVELLRRAGKEMYDNPIVNTAIGFTPVLGDVQAAGETMAALNRGAPWQETAGYAAGMLPFVPMIGKTVWHGSPHTFDKFDLSKIGTGEGAQAYGHGLYLAEARPTAEGYRESLAGKKMTDEEIDGMIRYAEANARKATDEKVKQGYTNAAEEYRQIKANEGQPGSLYKVDLPDEQIAKMLDWDKPLSEQAPEIQELARNLDISNAIGRNKGVMQAWREGRDVGITPRGEHLYESLAGSGKYQPQASQTLYEAGIPGIQYLDQASRGAGEGTRNYVVFSDEIPQILERNNIPVNK